MPSARSYPVHDLTKNRSLTRDEHAYSASLGEAIQALYDDAPGYITRHGLDRDVFEPGNEWITFVPTTGLRFRTEYNRINFLRLIAPFAGYHMAVLDRLDGGGLFPREEAEAFVRQLWHDIPDDVAELQRTRFDPQTRLQHVVPEYFDHIRNVPSRYIVRTPGMFGEIGLDVDGVLVNPDVVLCQSRINGMLCCGVLDKIQADIDSRGRARVLEIGAGHGGLAYALQRIFGERLEYVIVDLPSSLFFSTIYLSVLNGGGDCHVLVPGQRPPARFRHLFVANHLLDEALPSLGPIDLAINAMSFPEMSEAQVRYYGSVISGLIGEDGVLFEENGVVKPHHIDNKAIFAKMFPCHLHVSSEVVTTKNWCQDVWANRRLAPIFDGGNTTTNGVPGEPVDSRR